MSPRILLMSLKPGPFEEILAGRKLYEFRTRYPRGATAAFMYISTPVCAVEAVIRFGPPLMGTAEQMKTAIKSLGETARRELESYFHGKAGYALPVEQVALLEPVSLQELRQRFPGFPIPQSYCFLENRPGLLAFLRDRLPNDTREILSFP